MFAAKRCLGQSMTEYAIIVALIAISGISAFRYFGGVQRSQMAALTQELAGQDSGDMLDLAQSYASEACNDASRDKGLGDYYAGGGSSGGGSGSGGGTGSGGWLPPIGGGGGGWTPPGGGIFPPPGGGGGIARRALRRRRRALCTCGRRAMLKLIALSLNL